MKDFPFYFIVVFWGEEHRGHFLNLCLPALLSDNNIPALHDKARSRFVICTTAKDWAALQDHPTFELMKRHIEPLFLEIAHPSAEDNKMLVMSGGHKLASSRAFEDKACGVFLTPDLVLSDGSVAELQRLAGEGRKVVLCCAVRFTWEGCIPEIREQCTMEPGQPLTLPPRVLTGIALRHMHSETLRFNWERGYFADYPIACFWRVPDGSGIVIHSFSWAPLLVNYATLKDHSTETFDEWTLDGDYVHQNFPNEEDVHVVTDSDDIMLVSFTGEDELNYKLKRHLFKFWPLGDWTKIRLLRRLFYAPEMDPLKRQLFPKPVRWHGAETSALWDTVENRAAALITEAIAERPTGWTDYVYLLTGYGYWYTAREYTRYLRVHIPVLMKSKLALYRGNMIKLWHAMTRPFRNP